MDVVEHTSGNVSIYGGALNPPCIGLAPDALPEVQKPVLAENSLTGVSTQNALSRTVPKIIQKKKAIPHWYALRTTYGREKKAYEYLIGKNVEAFYPTLTSVKLVDGKRKTVTESRLPNIFFAYGTEEELKQYVYDNVNLPYLRFYYRHIRSGNQIEREPLIVPDNQIENLRIICKADADDIVVTSQEVSKFQTGQVVRVIDGKFEGVTGIVARYQGQQRVGIVIEGLLTVATAYIPSAFLEIVR